MSESAASSHPPALLLVDDTEENLTALEALLQDSGAWLLKARSGTEALELLLKHEVVLALLDVNMPQMDGFELAELMRGSERTRSVPIIFLTAATQSPGRAFRGYEAGAVDFLYKPLDPAVLHAKIGVFLELSRQRQQLSDQLDQLRAALRVNELFAAVLGHDLRNPLAAIVTTADLMIRSGPPEGVPRASRIRSAAGRMARMIEQLLDLARAREGRPIPVQIRPTDLAQACERIRTEHEPPEAPLRIELVHEGNSQGTWDPDRLDQVISNLLSNALKHGTPDTPVRMRVDGTDPDWVRLSVQNSGVIPPDAIDHLFAPFHASKGTRGSDSLGLGLYIVNQLVMAHGGTVTAQSTAEVGTIFEVRLPRCTDDEQPVTFSSGRVRVAAPASLAPGPGSD